jgi:hypothetical protein
VARRDLLAAAARLATRGRLGALHYRLLDWLGDDGQVDWFRAAIDGVSVRARRGGNDWRGPVDRASQDPNTTW